VRGPQTHIVSCALLAGLLATLVGGWPSLAAAVDGADEDLTAMEEQAIRAAVDRVAPSVVRIETVGGLERSGSVVFNSEPSTGLVVSPDGYIVTSAYALAHNPSSILVQLPDKQRAAARKVATDHTRHLVLLKIDAPQPLSVPEAADEASVRVGQWAIAVGRTLGEGTNASAGIISARDRIWGKALQTDAKVSPNNYGGPLIDIHGRVLGVLVPLSGDDRGVMAGSELYDSGIGFAVPLTHILERLPLLREGKDLEGGIMGVGMAAGGSFAAPKVAVVRSHSPADAAGLEKGDLIVEVAGQKVKTQAQLKQQLGRLYAGDKLRVVVQRGGKQIDCELTLVDKLPPYEEPLLGVLPLRPADDAKIDGILIRYVYPGSPAETAGLQSGDLITSLNGRRVKSRDEALEALRDIPPGGQIPLLAERGDEKLNLQATLAAQPTAIPASLPVARITRPPPPVGREKTGKVELKFPEVKNECFAYVPESYDPQVPHGVLLWLHPAGGEPDVELIARWQKHCRQHDLILLAPKSADKSRWQRREVDYIRKTLDQVINRYNVDPARVVVAGREAGGAMAWLVGLEHRDRVRGIAAIDAPLPPLVALPETDPLQPLSILVTTAKKSRHAARIRLGADQFAARKHAVTVVDQGELPHPLTAHERGQLVRWLDSLDRI